MKLKSLCVLSHSGHRLSPGDLFEEPSEHIAQKMIDRGYATPATTKKATKKKAKTEDE